MSFLEIPTGLPLFIDANTLVYHFVSDPTKGPSCKELMKRIAGQEIPACTSTHDVSDVAHRVMTIEAIQTNGWPIAGIAQRLKRHPAEIGKLHQFLQCVEEIPALGIQILSIAPDLMAEAARLSIQFGLLSGDALVLAVMQRNGIKHLASSDTDFDRVQGLTRFSPA